MTKVKVTREVAEAIDKLLAGNSDGRMNSYGIITKLDNAKELGRSPELQILRDYFNVVEWNSPRHPHALMKALVNGYEVGKTPEESARAYRDMIAGLVANHNYSLDNAMLLGIENTLDILGIKINGGDAE